MDMMCGFEFRGSALGGGGLRGQGLCALCQPGASQLSVSESQDVIAIICASA